MYIYIVLWLSYSYFLCRFFSSKYCETANYIQQCESSDVFIYFLCKTLLGVAALFCFPTCFTYSPAVRWSCYWTEGGSKKQGLFESRPILGTDIWIIIENYARNKLRANFVVRGSQFVLCLHRVVTLRDSSIRVTNLRFSWLPRIGLLGMDCKPAGQRSTRNKYVAHWISWHLYLPALPQPTCNTHR